MVLGDGAGEMAAQILDGLLRLRAPEGEDALLLVKDGAIGQPPLGEADELTRRLERGGERGHQAPQPLPVPRRRGTQEEVGDDLLPRGHRSRGERRRERIGQDAPDPVRRGRELIAARIARRVPCAMGSDDSAPVFDERRHVDEAVLGRLRQLLGAPIGARARHARPRRGDDAITLARRLDGGVGDGRDLGGP